MRRAIFILIALCLFSCRNSEEQGSEPTSEEDSAAKEWTDFTSKQYQIALGYPENYKVTEDSLAGNAPVINIFNSNNKAAGPYGIHEDFNEGYIAFLPNGFGVDGSNGALKKLSEFGNPLPLGFEIDAENSTAYLLKNGQTWGFFLRFYTPPESWTEYGGIFIRYPVADFEAVCLTENGEIEMRNCDPMGSEHQVEYRGEVSEKSINELNGILKTLHFVQEDFNRRELGDLINVDSPKEGVKISSPLKIKGEARGNWFFEANAGIEILDENFRKIGEGYIEVENANWMTEEFVPFTGEVTFEKPGSGKGYVVFKKANASGKPELDRIFRIPVSF